ncbi:MAG: NUDIX hydrolase [Candidatus Micrarchaeota archaeon]|nr:NUDIX hydrolase [Candidatus Micrarchaeota archaeon]
MVQYPIPFVAGIIEKRIGGKLHILLQTRWKFNVSPKYSGLYELPGGAIEAGENIYDALKREIKEETNLDVKRFVDLKVTDDISNIDGDSAFGFVPFCCAQMTRPIYFVGLFFVCEAEEGVLMAGKDEAKDPRWVSIDELAVMLKKERKKFFTPHVPALEMYLQARAGL